MVVVGLILVTFAVVAVTTLVRYFRRDEADQILERNAANATANRDARIAAAAIRDDEAYRLEQFEETGVLPASRMDTLLRPVESPKSLELEELLSRYQFFLDLDTEAGKASLVDLKFFGLKKKRYNVSIADIAMAGVKEWKPILKSARYNVNRRAVNQGLVAKLGNRGRKPKVVIGAI
jgi:hypothetical protein